MLCGVTLVRNDVSELVFLRSMRRLLVSLTLFLVHRFLSPWWWRRWVPPKRRFIQDPHDVTSLKTALFIVTAVKISNLTLDKLIEVLHLTTSVRLWDICEILSIPDCLDNRLTHGGYIMTYTPTALYSQEISFGTNFCSRLTRTKDHDAAGRIRYIEKKNSVTSSEQPFELV
jgi:hypothetical protein